MYCRQPVRNADHFRVTGHSPAIPLLDERIGDFPPIEGIPFTIRDLILPIPADVTSWEYLEDSCARHWAIVHRGVLCLQRLLELDSNPNDEE